MRINCGVRTVKRALPKVTTAFGSATGLSGMAAPLATGVCAAGFAVSVFAADCAGDPKLAAINRPPMQNQEKIRTAFLLRPFSKGKATTTGEEPDYGLQVVCCPAGFGCFLVTGDLRQRGFHDRRAFDPMES
jgi:hypothetical protein